MSEPTKASSSKWPWTSGVVHSAGAWSKRVVQVLQILLDGVRTACAAFPDKRRGGDVTYSMADIGLSAFSLFFMQSESFLSHQRGLEEGRKMSNCWTLFGMKATPTDNHIRERSAWIRGADASTLPASGVGRRGRSLGAPAPTGR